MPSSTVRLGTPKDREAVLMLVERMHAESWFRRFRFDPSKIRYLYDTAMQSPDWVCFVAEQDSKVIGFYYGGITQHFFGPDTYACDLGLYVDRSYRGSTIGIRLLKAFEAWAMGKGVREICLGISTDIMADRTGELYKKLGYTSTAYTYRKCVERA